MDTQQPNDVWEGGARGTYKNTDYVDLRDAEGRKFLSPHRLSNLYRKDFRHRTTRPKITGTLTHQLIESIVGGGREIHVSGPALKEDGTPARKGSAEYKALEKQLSETREEGSWVILNQTDYNTVGPALEGVSEFVKYIREMTLGPSVETFEKMYVFPLKAMLDFRFEYEYVQDKWHYLCRVVKETGHAGVRFCPDWVLAGEDSLVVVDWKTTSKDTVDEKIKQAFWLDYHLSMSLYGLLLSAYYFHADVGRNGGEANLILAMLGSPGVLGLARVYPERNEDTKYVTEASRLDRRFYDKVMTGFEMKTKLEKRKFGLLWDKPSSV